MPTDQFGYIFQNADGYVTALWSIDAEHTGPLTLTFDQTTPVTVVNLMGEKCVQDLNRIDAIKGITIDVDENMTLIHSEAFPAINDTCYFLTGGGLNRIKNAIETLPGSYDTIAIGDDGIYEENYGVMGINGISKSVRRWIGHPKLTAPIRRTRTSGSPAPRRSNWAVTTAGASRSGAKVRPTWFMVSLPPGGCRTEGPSHSKTCALRATEMVGPGTEGAFLPPWMGRGRFISSSTIVNLSI
jgi:hypothetical protein